MSYNGLEDDEEKRFALIVNDETLDSDYALNRTTLYGMEMALAILQASPIQVELRQQALDFISSYGRYDEAPIKDILTKEDLHAIHVRQYGSEEEATAQERFDFLHNSLTPAHDDHPRLWHKDAQSLWHLLESTQIGSGVWTFYYEQGQDTEQMRTIGSPDYLYRRDLSALIREVRDRFKVEIYDIPVEQWTFSPDVKGE